MIEIESNIPLPAATRTTKGDAKYPFAVMLVGQSFAIPSTKEDADKVAGRLRGAAGRFATESGGTVKFAVRKLETEVRVWRTA